MQTSISFSRLKLTSLRDTLDHCVGRAKKVLESQDLSLAKNVSLSLEMLFYFFSLSSFYWLWQRLQSKAISFHPRRR